MLSALNSRTAADPLLDSITEAPLGAGGEWLGKWESVATAGSLSVWAYCDVPATLFVQLSDDMENVRQSVQRSSGTDGVMSIHHIAPANAWVRVRVVIGDQVPGELAVQVLRSANRLPFQVTEATEVGRFSDLTITRQANDPQLDTARGLFSRFNLRKLGRNPDVGTAGAEDIWSPGTAYAWPTSPSTIRIKAGGDVNDTAAGTGARSVTIYGLAADWTLQEVTLATAGSSASAASSETFIRVFRAVVESTGTYGGANTGTVQVEAVTGGAVLAVIPAGIGRTLMSQYTIPDGYAGYLKHVQVKIGGAGSKTASVNMWVRPGADTVAAPFTGTRLIWAVDELAGGSSTSESLHSYEPLPARTDIWFTAVFQSTSGPVDVTYELDLVEV